MGEEARKRFRIRSEVAVCDLLLDLLAIDTSVYGSGTPQALGLVGNFLSEYGVADVRIDNLGETPVLIASLNADTGNRRPGLILFSHIDTACWEEERWKTSPLGERTEEGMIFGRGALDCKSQVAVHAGLLSSLLHGHGVRRNVLLIVTADEESGGSDGMGRLCKDSSILAGYKWALGEGGGFILPPEKKGSSKRSSITCQAGERGRLLCSVSGEADRRPLPVFDGRRREPRRREDRYLDPIKRESTYEVCEGTAIINIAPGAKIEIIRKSLHQEGLLASDVPCRFVAQPYRSRSSGALYRAIRKASKRHQWNRVIPVVSPGYSDARFLREAGIETYGFFPMGEREPLSGIHGSDECIHKDTLVQAYGVLGDVIDAFA